MGRNQVIIINPATMGKMQIYPKSDIVGRFLGTNGSVESHDSETNVQYCTEVLRSVVA